MSRRKPLTFNSLPSHSLQAEFHRRIKVMPGFTKRLQGLVMQEFREVVIEPNAKAVRFAEAVCETPFDNEFGNCLQCGHGGNLMEAHTDECLYLEAMRFLGRECWVKPPEPKYLMRRVCALYVKPGMHLVVDDCLCEVKSIAASEKEHPNHFAFEVMTETGIAETFHFTRLQDVYILADE